MSDSFMIREATRHDLDAVIDVNRQAFGQEDEAVLVSRLLDDPTAWPILSLVAAEDDDLVGHILFTRVEAPGLEQARLLAPMSVVPSHQGLGIGGTLIAAGLDRLTQSGVDAVFVLGYPSYYPRHGFEPALPHGFEPPHPLPEANHDAWMMRALGALASTEGCTVRCAASLMRPEYWRE